MIAALMRLAAWTAAIALALGAVFLGQGCPAGKPTLPKTVAAPVRRGDWYMLDHDCGHTSRSNTLTLQQPKLLWKKGSGKETFCPSSQVVFLSNNSGVYGNESWRLISITPEGKVAWRRGLFAGAEITPALLPDGACLTADASSTLWKYQPSGRLAWAVQHDGLIGPPCVSASDKIIINGVGGYGMLQFSLTGQLDWQYDSEAKGGIGGETAAVDSRNNSYFMMRYDGLYCLDPAGKLAWKCATDQESVNNCPVIYGDRGVLVAGFERVCLVSYSGKLLWGYTPGAPVYCRMLCLSARDEVLLADESGALHCLDAAGKQRWRTPGYAGPWALISTAKADLLYLLCEQHLVVVNSATGELISSTALPASGRGGSLSARDDGVLVAMLAGNMIAAFGEAGAKP